MKSYEPPLQQFNELTARFVNRFPRRGEWFSARSNYRAAVDRRKLTAQPARRAIHYLLIVAFHDWLID
jgi:hypothetical protein